MPPGCTGELLLEGPLVGRGYLNEPEKTAASFIHDPAWLLQGSPSRPGRHGRIYKTGDLVRYDEDGNLIFVSRKDTQVKIRGQRVELGEVESAVLKCIPEASQTVVEIILPQGENSSPALTAFIRVDRVPEAAKPVLNSPDIHILPNAMEVKQQLALYLPKYMIPELFLFCPQLPMTATGKINRRGIREMGGSLSWAAVEQSSDALGSLVAASGGPIPSTEQPAYELAQKIFKMIPPWHQCSLASKKYETTFDDVLLLYSGLDSVNMMTLIYFISQHFHVKVGMQFLLDPTTSIRSLARFISDLRLVSLGQTPLAQPSASLDLIAEIDRHDVGIATAQREGLSLAQADPEPTSRDNKPLIVFLTGASGFIGTQILRQLLEHRHVGSVIAIVRGQTTSAARSRTIDSAKRALWWTDAHEEKLVVWSGDLSLPNLGLDPTHWGILADGKTVDVFIHNAAVVHWGRSYAALVDANVKSTVQLLHLAVGAPNTRFVYVTGGRMGVTEDEREEDVARELLTAGATDADGYGQTKFVAESVVRRAALRCSPGQARLAVAAPGLVIGTPAEGVPNTDDYIWRLVAACIRTHSYNADDSDQWLAVSDVAVMATMIIDTALDPTTALITKSRDGMTWGEFWAIIQDMGYQLQGCCAAEWLAAVREDIEISRETHPLWPVAYMLETEGEASKEKKDSSLEMGNTPETLRLAVRKNVEFLGRVGFLPHSPAAPEDVKRATCIEAFSRSLAGPRAV
jgi:thioester reductase-like protein